jgi:hypothetical protein
VESIGVGSRLKGQPFIDRQVKEYVETGERVPFAPKLSFFELGGSGSGRATVREIKDLLDRMREEDA